MRTRLVVAVSRAPRNGAVPEEHTEQKLALVAGNVLVGRVVEAQPDTRRVRAWNICATVAIIWLAISPVIQDSFHRSFQVGEPSGVPNDFPGYFIASQVAARKAPDNCLYFPPDRRSWSFLDLRVDATTPYGKFVPVSNAPPQAVKYPFITPPLSSLLMEPLARLAWQKAYFVWQLLCVLMMMASLYLALRLARDDLPPVAMPIALALAFLFRPFRAELASGNIDVAILFIWVVGAFALQQRLPILSALCFALATAIKVSPIFAVPLLALRRQWRWLFAYALASAALLALSGWWAGWQNQMLWAGHVAPAISWGIKGFYNRSLPGLVLALSDPHNLRTFLPASPACRLLNSVASGLGYVAFLLWCWRQRKDSQALPVELILLPVIILLLSPFSWTGHYVLALPVLVNLWVRLRAQVGSASNLDLVLLTGSTMLIGSVLTDSCVLALGLHFELLVMACWVAATWALVWVGLTTLKGHVDFA